MRPIIEPPDIAEYADIIKERVTIEEAVRFYFNAVPRHNRIPCPLHGGKDLNFSFKRNFYRCFVCGKSGDVISLVRDYFGLSFPDAVRKLNDDFQIGLAVDGGGSTDPTALRAAAELRRRRQEREADFEEAKSRYEAALDEWVRCDRALREKPVGDPDHDRAERDIARAAYYLDEEETNLAKFRSQRG